MSQENLQTMIMQNFWGVKEVYYGIVEVVNSTELFYAVGRGEHTAQVPSVRGNR